MNLTYPEIDFEDATLILPYCSTHELLWRNGCWERYPKAALDEIVALSEPIVVEKVCEKCQPSQADAQPSPPLYEGDTL